MQYRYLVRFTILGVFALTCLPWAQKATALDAYQRGREALADRNYEAAIDHLQDALKSDPNNADCLNNLGFALRQMSDKYLNDAYKYYLMALKVNPNHEETLEFLGELYITQGDLLKANDILKKLKKLESAEAETLGEKLKKIAGQAKKIKS